MLLGMSGISTEEECASFHARYLPRKAAEFFLENTLCKKSCFTTVFKRGSAQDCPCVSTGRKLLYFLGGGANRIHRPVALPTGFEFDEWSGNIDSGERIAEGVRLRVEFLMCCVEGR